jgi:hypothetical protein
MILSIFLSATLILLIFYAVAPKRLHLFEILFCWMVFLFLHGTVMAHAMLNYKTIQLNPNIYLVWTFFFNRFLLMPLLIVWLMDLYSSIRSFIIKSILTVVFISFLVGIEFSSDRLQIIRHVENWRVWWSIIIWVSLILSVYILMRWFRNILKKEVNAE